mmetsp:Transcript_93916/g.223451  ORF Transcript_93916/g.223451 Transcript_93916/m.223451 type:complete len:94 (+) Transcript_93916:63-344(+)
MGRCIVLPCLLAMAAMLCATNFVNGCRSTTTSLRHGGTRALPETFETLELGSSLNSALEVSTPGWWANIVTLVVPLAILITLYLQSERRKANL